MWVYALIVTSACLKPWVTGQGCIFLKKHVSLRVNRAVIGYVYGLAGRCKAQWIPPWSRAQSQVNAIHLVRSTGTIASVTHLHRAKNCREKSAPIKCIGWIDSVMIVIEYSYKLGRKNNFHLWCELGWLANRQSQLLITYYNFIEFARTNMRTY